jgi:hypothetical protein
MRMQEMEFSEESQRKCVGKPRGRPFEPGNPGKPKGTRHRTTLAVEALLEGEADRLTRKAIVLALAGDVTALRLCLERIAPARKDRPVSFDLPPLDGADDMAAASAALIRAVAEGQLTPFEAAQIAKLFEVHVHAIEMTEITRRLAQLEEMLDRAWNGNQLRQPDSATDRAAAKS